MTLRLVLFVVVVVGCATAYVSPDNQGRANSGQSTNVNPNQRAKPRSLAAQHAEQGAALRAQAARAPRVTRDVAGGSYSSSGSGAGSFSGGGGGGGGGGGVYQQSSSGPGFGFAGAGVGGNPFSFYPFHNPNAQGFGPALDFGSFYNYLQQMQNALQQNALNQGVTNSFGIATRHGVFGPTGYIGSSSNSFGGNGGGNGYGGSFSPNQQGGGNGFGGSYGGEGASAFASLGPQGGFGSAQLTPDLGNRFGSQSGQLPPSSGGGPIGVFTSSSSGSSNINGQQTNYKEATSTINDNGKITTFTVRDPPNQ